MGEVNAMGRNQRREPRQYVDEPAELNFGGGGFECRIVDITSTGAGLYCDPMPADVPSEGVLSSARFGQIHCDIKYTALTRIGVEFTQSDQARDELRQKLSDMGLH